MKPHFDKVADLMYIKVRVEDGRPIKPIGPIPRWNADEYIANVIALGALIQGQRIISAILVPAHH